MQPKKDLNNVQRKMLDQIYSEQFAKKERVILDKRNQEYSELERKVLQKESAKPGVKKLLKVGAEFLALVEQNKAALADMGLEVYPSVDKKPELKFKYSYQHYQEHPDLTAHKNETRRIELELSEKKKEMRAKIYGANITYEDAEKEINAILKGIKGV